MCEIVDKNIMNGAIWQTEKRSEFTYLLKSFLITTIFIGLLVELVYINEIQLVSHTTNDWVSPVPYIVVSLQQLEERPVTFSLLILKDSDKVCIKESDPSE